MKEAESIIKKCDVALLSYQKQLDKDKECMLKVIEDYKTLDAFQDEVMKASEGAFDYGFLSCRNLIIKLFPNLDLSKVTVEAALAVASEVSFGVTSGAPTMVPPATHPADVPPTDVPANPAQVLIIEVTMMELVDKNFAPASPCIAK